MSPYRVIIHLVPFMIFVCRNNISVIKLRPEVVSDARTFNAKQFKKKIRRKMNMLTWQQFGYVH